MAIDVDRVQLLCLFLSVSEAFVSKLYTVNFEYDSKASMHTPSDTLPAASLPICASMCGNRCQCFSFNSQTKMCRLHSSCNPDNMTVSNTEWKSYTNPTMRPKGMWFGSLLAFKTMYQLYLVDITFFELLISTNYLFVLYLTIHIHILLIKTIFPLVYIIIFWIYWIYSTKLLSDNLFVYDKIDQT